MSETEICRNLYKIGIPPYKIVLLSGLPINTVRDILNIEHKELVFTGQNKWRGRGREMVRFLVRKRDSFTCQSCRKKWESGNRHFDVHHLGGMCGKKSRGYDRVADMNGLITLCHKCHYHHPEHSQKLST